jgi:hypothetical protein
MLATGFDAATAAHSTSSFIVGVTTFEHSSYAYRIAAKASGTKGTASAWHP